MILVDGHLDIAFSALAYGRDPRVSALVTRKREGALGNRIGRGHCMIGLPELQAGRVAVVFATLFVAPRDGWPGSPDAPVVYGNSAEAEARAREQLRFYEGLAEEEAGFRLVRSRADLADVLAGWEDGATGDVGLVVLMEGADPIRSPALVADWFADGVRIVGLTWMRGRYAGGNGAPGPLVPGAGELLGALNEAGLVLDLSHTCEESFHAALDFFDGPVIASHSNPREVCPGERQLTDRMIRRIAERDGVIGAVPYGGQLQKGWYDTGRPWVPLRRVAEAVAHVAQVAGTHRAAAIGSDFDGGFGAESTPWELDTVADLSRLADALADVNFTDEMIFDVLGRNWIRLLERALPADSA